MLTKISSSNPKVIRILSPKLSDIGYNLHLVDSHRVGLLIVEQIKEEYRIYTTRRFNVYKFDFRAGQWSSNLMDIGDDILFVGGENLVSISVTDCPTPTLFEENTIH